MSATDSIFKTLAKYADLPDGWIFHGTELRVGDMRVLAAEVEELREKLITKTRDEVLRAAIALAAGAQAGGAAFSESQAINQAFLLIKKVDEEFAKEPI